MWLAQRYLGAATVAGADIAERSIAYCREAMGGPTARFTVADAERVPFDTASFDAVLSVETSCTYPRNRYGQIQGHGQPL